ncbi:MAG: DnaJ domain-containing protein [Alphaproteobacteria bacterium]|nr:DnaJ domain-containing protein [Alphaproteobacteria bacterium]
MAKRSKKDFAPHVTGDETQCCEAEGCTQEGIYKAPKSRDRLHEYRYFCLDHVREHNKMWDYFSGMGAEEIEAFMKDAVTGHRPTWERVGNISDPQEKLYNAVNDFLNVNRKITKPAPHVSAKVRKALALFEIDYPYTASALKIQYKTLVKRTHPDRNPGDKFAEEKFKAVASAYKVLEAHLHES